MNFIIYVTSVYLLALSTDIKASESSGCCSPTNKKPIQLSDDCDIFATFDDALTGDERELAKFIGLACAIECEAKDKEIFDGSEISKSKFVEDFKKTYGDWAEQAVESKYNDCKISAEESRSRLPGSVKDDCNPLPYFMNLCLRTIIEQKCPKSQLFQTPECLEKSKAGFLGVIPQVIGK